MVFYNQAELAVVRGRLESEGIECFVPDEMMVQASQYYVATGGIRLQVHERDLRQATGILKEGGYIKDSDHQSSKTIVKIDRATSKIPLLGKMRFEVRITILVTIIVTVAAVIFYFATLPSTFDRLTSQRWCLHEITHNGVAYSTNTVDSYLPMTDESCRDRVVIRPDGRITLPGINSRGVRAEWKLDGERLEIFGADTLGSFYNGIYDVNFSGIALILSSGHTILYCTPSDIYINFAY